MIFDLQFPWGTFIFFEIKLILYLRAKNSTTQLTSDDVKFNDSFDDANDWENDWNGTSCW